MPLFKFILFVFTWLMIVAGNVRIIWLEWRLDREDRLQLRLNRVQDRVARREARLQRLGW